MKLELYFSVWFGNFETETEFDIYTEVIHPIFDDSDGFDPASLFIDIPEEHVQSGFINDFDLDSCKYNEDYDEDFAEFHYKEDLTSDYKELLKGCSYYDDIILKILDVTGPLNNEKFNSILILYNYRYQQPIKKNAEGNVVFIGAFKFNP